MRQRIIVAVVGMVAAWVFSWLCDDIFITLRYVQQWLSGNGLVYNVGEYVEGYTHPLWLAMIALTAKVGVEPETFVVFAGIVSFGVMLYILGWWELIPAVLVVINYEMRVWATSGLETMFFTLLVVLWAWMLKRGRYTWAGLFMSLAVLTRPDAVLLAGVGLAYVLWANKTHVWQYLAPFGLVVAHLAWRYSYYGDLLPLPFYAKSGGGMYWDQGIEYLWTWFRTYPSSLIFLCAVPLLGKDKFLTLLFASIVTYLVLFVARVGGDFMFARFMVPVVPFMYLAGFLALLRFIPQHKEVFAILLIALVGYESMSRDFTKNNKRVLTLDSGITDEREYWVSLDAVNSNRYISEVINGVFKGEKLRVLLRGQASLAYYARFDYAMENFGLTDKYIATLPIDKRTRPGHEKAAPLAYMRQKGIQFCFGRSQIDRSNPMLLIETDKGKLQAEVITLDTAMFKRIGIRGK